MYAHLCRRQFHLVVFLVVVVVVVVDDDVSFHFLGREYDRISLDGELAGAIDTFVHLNALGQRSEQRTILLFAILEHFFQVPRASALVFGKFHFLFQDKTCQVKSRRDEPREEERRGEEARRDAT
jgi:hypothetical protein